MNINMGAKGGIMIEIIALVTIILITIFNKTIPSLLSWSFVIGLAIALAGTLVDMTKKNNKI
ncbi:hypothetical protein [Clostridium sp.]|uniref:hypothetical protein n=1 Tax=Clostridium sp. TaxID=1506 RepID=UPI00258E53BD|nr:hypothetical protein [Clostridium sp.]